MSDAIARAVAAAKSAVASRAPAPERAAAFLQLGQTLDAHGLADRASRAYAQAVRALPSSHETYYALGVSLGRGERAAAAMDAFKASCKLAPRHAMSHRALAITTTMLDRHTETVHHLRTALRIQPVYDEAEFELAVSLQHLRNDTESLAVYDRLLARSPRNAPALTNRGTLLKDIGRQAEAAVTYERALRVAPGMAEVYNNLAVLAAGELREPKRALRLIAAGRAIERIASEPGYLRASGALEWSSAEGLALTQLRRFGEAAVAFGEAQRAFPQSSDTACYLALSRMRIADWKDVDEQLARASTFLRSGACERSWDPLYGLAMPHLRAPLLRQLAQGVTRRKMAMAVSARRALGPPTWWGRAAALARSTSSSSGSSSVPLRVGYLSADFRHHVMAFLTLGLLSRAVESKGFEVYALSLSPEDRTDWQARVRNAVSPRRFIDVSSASDGATHGKTDALSIARAIRDLELDVVVDLNGYTSYERSELLSLSLAPLTIQAVGYPGTMASDAVPYMLLDAIAMPPKPREALHERLVLQPHCYQVNDHARRLSLLRAEDNSGSGEAASEASSSKAAVAVGGGAGPVLVNFNQIYKISPATGALWCNLLLAQPGTTLWLLRQPADGEPNLRDELAACGVSRSRVVFAPLVNEIDDHLRRTAQAGLVVDTLEYNCHTTGSDALWAGVPMLTVPGESMASRVGRSLLEASAMAGGVVSSLREYVDVGAALIRPPPAWARLPDEDGKQSAPSPLWV